MSDMWLPSDEDPRDQTPTRGEWENLSAYLRNYRTIFALKCDGLDAEQLARRSVPPSTLSLLGLLRHLAGVEHSWNKRFLQQQMHLERLYRKPGERDWAFDGATADEAVVAQAWESWRRESAECQAWLEHDDLDRLVEDDGGAYEVRDIVVHLIEEYARHVGHADLLRECIDGRTGQ